MPEHAHHVTIDWNFLSDSNDPDVIGVRVGSFLSAATKHWRDEHEELELSSMSSIRIVFESLADVKDRLNRDQLLLDDIKARVGEIHQKVGEFGVRLDSEFQDEFVDICSDYMALLTLQMQLMNARADESDLHDPFEGFGGGENN